MKPILSSLLLFTGFLGAVGGLLLFPQEVSCAVANALLLCTDTLLPNLFPFMVLSGLFIRSGLADGLGAKADKLMSAVFHLPGTCLLALLFGMIGGYPTGARTVVSLYQSGACSREDAERTLAFCNNCGPGYLITGIGYGLFRDVKLGVMLYFVHITAAVLTGFMLAPAKKTTSKQRAAASVQPPSLSSAFVTSVTDGMSSFINLCAFVICFSAILVLAERSGVPSLIASLLPFSEENGTWFLLGFLEMTCGVSHLVAGEFSEQLILISALTAWGGLSVHCQVISLLQGTGLSSSGYLKGKALHGGLAAFLTAIIVTGTPLFYAGLAAIIFLHILRAAKKRSGNACKNVL